MTRSPQREDGPADGFVLLDGAVPAYRIVDHERLEPFLMTVVSAWDHWLFVSSTGGIAAGRVGPDRGLFPYETDDRLHRLAGITGPLTALRIKADGGTHLWEPFRRRRAPGVRRHLTKSLVGDRLELEEVNEALGLTFRYQWCTSNELGLVRRCTLERHPGWAPVEIALLDGLVNLMPPHVELGAQQGSSCLVDAYKLAERTDHGLAMYSLTARIVDRAEPAEALRGTVAWSHGLEPDALLLSDVQVPAFLAGRPLQDEARVTGRRFAYLVAATLHLSPGHAHRWHIAGDVHRSPNEIVALRRRLADASNLDRAIAASVDAGSARLAELVASADGAQRTGEPMADAHHFANVLFNIMRGGVFVDGHRVARDDVLRFLDARNRRAHERHLARLEGLAEVAPLSDLIETARRSADPNLLRLAYEYLPLTFSRRHGDPSRPWNRFTIAVTDEDGRPSLGYEGNWRDIFQNWEALSWSFPGFIESVIAKFVNASTVDGFNPYRITREGIDWEVPEPDNPWSNIGYWGDHQTIYLLKLLEASTRFHPEALDALIEAPVFSFADVPYRLAPYEELVADPHRTIAFDAELDATIARRVEEVGADGRLVHDGEGRVVHVTLAEKLLISALTRLSNFVPDGGIWMNTQRPEWNDANNALVGHGISMVTLCYLRRYVSFLRDLLEPRRGGEVMLSGRVATWLDDVLEVLVEHAPLLAAPRIDDGSRRRVLDALGRAYSTYRGAVYQGGLGASEPRPYERLLTLMETARDWLDHAIVANRREDGLYHAYNLLALGDGEARVDHLYEMLEGQVAVLSSGLLTAAESLEVVDALFASAMYREDQRSFTLYPNRRLPGLLERGIVSAEAVAENGLLSASIHRHRRPIVRRDVEGVHRFDPDLRNARDLEAALDELAADAEWADLVADHRDATLRLYEATFQHRAFTGRSGTMVAYEGLGSIYWHMVSKLLLAIQETYQRATDAGDAERLAQAYARVRAGLSASKTPAEYGAFPADPYSHTPGHRGAQQPGMTGQVKEEVLCRWGELGITIEGGCLRLSPGLLSPPIPDDGLALTFCGVPVRYVRGDVARIAVHRADGEVTRHEGDSLDVATSAAVFGRTGAIARIEVTTPGARRAPSA